LQHQYYLGFVSGKLPAGNIPTQVKKLNDQGGVMDFETAFKTLTGFPPFVWQKRLFDQYFRNGEIPAALDLPTGRGKK